MDTYQEIAGRPCPGIDSMRCLGQSEDNGQDLFQEVRRTGRIGWPVCRRINDMVSIYPKQSFFQFFLDKILQLGIFTKLMTG